MIMNASVCMPHKYLYTHIHIIWVCNVFSPLQGEKEDVKFCEYKTITKFERTMLIFSRNTILSVLPKVCTRLEKEAFTLRQDGLKPLTLDYGL